MNVALITGAASGIGLALTTVCLEKKMFVIMVDKERHKLEQERFTLNHQFPNQVSAFSCDITKTEEITGLADELYKQKIEIDWLFNNAGIMGSFAPLWELDLSNVQKVMEVNVYGMIHLIKAFMPYLFQQHKRSHIINMASLYALCTGSQLASYSMSKHAVLALSESLHYDLKRLEKPVDVSVVFPSFTDTALLSQPSAYEQPVFHNTLNSLLAHSRPAKEVAAQIIQEVEQNKFYIFPDKEVKGYCEERTQSMIKQEEPHANNIEKLICSLIKRTRFSNP